MRRIYFLTKDPQLAFCCLEGLRQLGLSLADIHLVAAEASNPGSGAGSYDHLPVYAVNGGRLLAGGATVTLGRELLARPELLIATLLGVVQSHPEVESTLAALREQGQALIATDVPKERVREFREALQHRCGIDRSCLRERKLSRLEELLH